MWMQAGEDARAPDPDIRRIRETRCDVGQYLILVNDKVEERVADYVTAEIKAHVLARSKPGFRVVVAKGVLEVKGVPHVYEVHPT
jgi:hypothetical protein